MNYGRPSLWSSIPSITKNLIVINLIMWLASILLPRFDIDLRDILGMHYWASTKFSVAQMLTYSFMHGGFSHIFFNMFALFMFGSALEQHWGSKRFLLYYLLTGVGAGLVQQLVWTLEFRSLVVAMNEAIEAGTADALLPFQSQLERYFRISNLEFFTTSDFLDLKHLFLDGLLTVGASGSVFGLLLAFGWLFPQARLMMLFIPIPIPSRIFVALYGLAELFLGVANFSGDSVAHFAHLGGMLFGCILILYWKKRRTF